MLRRAQAGMPCKSWAGKMLPQASLVAHNLITVSLEKGTVWLC